MLASNAVYIAQASAGGDNGTSCLNSYAITYFNTSGNWSGSPTGTQIGPGTTVHLCGAITSELSFSGGGSSGSVITIVFETGASIQITPGCDGNGCVNLGAYSYILIDGGANRPCGWNVATNVSEGSCNGQIENMLYGSSDGVCPGGTCTTQATTGNLIQGTGGSNIEIRNLQVGPSYIHTSTGNSGNDTGGTQGIALTNGSNWNIHDNKLHDASWHEVLAYTGGGAYGTWAITNNEMYNNSHMVAVAGADSSALNGMTMTGNYTHDMGNWDTSGDAWHANAIHTYGDTTSTLTNQTIANNIMGGNPGADMTSQIFSESQKTGSVSNISVYNNLLYAVGGLQGGERLFLFTQCDSNCLLVNNTLYGNSSVNGTCLYFTGTYHWTVENNAVGGCNLQAYTSGALGGTYNYNAYFRGNALLNIFDCNGTQTNTWSDWQACSSEGSNSLHNLNNSTGLGLDAAYVPKSGSPLPGAGTNLAGLGITALDSDLAGNPRPNSGAWDIGAYNYIPPAGYLSGAFLSGSTVQ